MALAHLNGSRQSDTQITSHPSHWSSRPLCAQPLDMQAIIIITLQL